MPGGVHAAEVVVAVGGGDEGGHLALGPVEHGEGVEPVHDDGDGLVHHADDGLVVHLDGLVVGGGARGGEPGLVLQTLPVAGYHLVAQDCTQDRLNLNVSQVFHSPDLYLIFRSLLTCR